MQSLTILEDPMTVEWDDVTRAEALRAIQEYDRLGPEEFFSEHGFAPTPTYDLVWDEHCYPPKAILGTAYEFATGQRLASGDFEGGKAGAVSVLGNLGFTIRPRRPPAEAGPDVSRGVNGNPKLATAAVACIQGLDDRLWLGARVAAGLLGGAQSVVTTTLPWASPSPTYRNASGTSSSPNVRSMWMPM